MASKQQKQSIKTSQAKAEAYTGADKEPDISVRDSIINAAMSLAAVQAWEHCSVRDIAQEAGVSLADFYDHFDERNDVIVAFVRRIDRQVLETFSEPDYEASPRDRLFDLLMERFDAAGEYREALTSIIKSHRLDPKQALTALPHLAGSMTKMLEAAGIETIGLRGAARVAGLSAGFMWVVKTWVDDDSQDLSCTMAALDKCLGHLERAANTFGL